MWDIFISHASEDKATVARPLARELEAAGLRVWLDEQEILLGDSISQKINDGIAFSQYGIVIFSPAFFANRFTMAELNAVINRHIYGAGCLLPILHGVTAADVRERAALVGDIGSVSTQLGIPAVAQRILQKIGLQSGQVARPSPRRYFDNFAFPEEFIRNAWGGVQLLQNPRFWEHLSPRQDMEQRTVWMGSDAEACVTVLFDLYAPLVHFHGMKGDLVRTLTTLDVASRVRYGILNCCLQALFEEFFLAAAEPTLVYSPRSSGWRQQRARNPQQFWWQGLTEDRFRAAARHFSASGPSHGEPDFKYFQNQYQLAYRSADTDQQEIGLLANALYGFKPASRPVYWRLLLLWGELYAALLTLEPGATRNELESQFLENAVIREPAALTAVPRALLPESADATWTALTQYYAEHIKPKLRTYIRAM